MNNDIELYNRIADPISAIEKMGQFFARSGMFGCDRTEQGNVLAMTCLVERKSPVEICATYHLQDGKLTMKAEAMLAKFHQGGGKSKIISRTPDKAELELSKPDGSKATFSFTFDEAKIEDYVFAKDGKTFKRNWSTPRKRMQMLWARVVSDGVRSMMPEILVGSYTPEEVADESGHALPTPEKQLLTTSTITAPEVAMLKKTTVQVAIPQTEDGDIGPVKMIEAAPAAPAAPTVRASIDDATGKLTAGTVLALQEAITDQHENAAMKWLEAKGWICPMGGLHDLSLERANKILSKPDAFITAITKA